MYAQNRGVERMHPNSSHRAPLERAGQGDSEKTFIVLYMTFFRVELIHTDLPSNWQTPKS